MKFFDHKDLGNNLLQLCLKVVKHPVHPPFCICVCVCVCVCMFVRARARVETGSSADITVFMSIRLQGAK